MKQSQTKRLPVRVSPTFRILLAMVFGGLFGVVVGPRAGGMGEVGNVVIGLIKTLATPLIFFAVIDAFLRTTVRAKSGLLMLGISAVNATLAVVIALTLSNTLQPGRYLCIPSQARVSRDVVRGVRPVHFLEDLLALIPANIVDPFRTNSIIPVVVLAITGGLALRRHKDEQTAVGGLGYRLIEDFVEAVLRALELLLGWVVALLPLAVFMVMAQTVGTQGLSALRGLALYLGVVVLGLAMHVGLVYQAWVVFVARVPLAWFWAALRAPLAYAAGASSSLATLPVTLRSLRAMGVSDGSARMSACVATNVNNDGILLYEAMAALIVAQAYGIDLSFGQQMLLAATCVLASVGIAGIPEAGMISLAVVLTTANLPLDLLPLLLSVDWILGRCRAMTNVVGDVLGAVLLDRLLPCSSVDEGGSISVGRSSSVSARDPSELETVA
jgi:Na+/H+-dicarboxylate symporter